MTGSAAILFPDAAGWWLAGILALFLPALWLRRRKRSVRITTFFLLRGAAAEAAQLSPRLMRLRRLGTTLFLMAATALAVAGFRPAFSSGQRPLRELAVVDLSPSLGVVEGGRARIDALRAALRGYLGLLRPEDSLELVLADALPTAHPLGGGGRARAFVVERLDYQDRPADVPAAIDLVRALQAKGPFDNVLVFTDAPGRWRSAFDAPGVDGLSPRFVGTGRAAANAGITAFDLKGDFFSSGSHRVYCGIVSRDANGEARPFSGTLTIANNGRAVRTLPVEVSAAGRQELVVHDLTLEPGEVAARLDPPDAYAADNRVSAGVAAAARVRVTLVTASNRFLREALAANPAVELRVIGPDEPLAADPESVFIFDGFAPAGQLPERALFIQPNREVEGLVYRSYLPPPDLITGDEAEPVLQGVDLEGLTVKGYMALEHTGSYREVASADGHPLILLGTEGRNRWAVLAFDPSQTTFVYTGSYPILVANLVRWLTLLTGGTRPWFLPGDPVFLPEAAEAGAVQGPDGVRHLVERAGPSGRVFVARHPGRYQVRSSAGRPLGDFHVNVLDPAVTEGVARAAGPAAVEHPPDGPRRGPLRGEFLPGLLIAGLALLAAERLVQPPQRSGRE